MSNTVARPTNQLLLKPLDASRTLGISERTLWAQTQPRGPIPCVRIGNCVRYSVEQLQAYIASANSIDEKQHP